MENILDSFENFQNDRDQQSPNTDFLLVDDPIWHLREPKQQLNTDSNIDNSNIDNGKIDNVTNKPIDVDNLDKSPIDTSNVDQGLLKLFRSFPNHQRHDRNWNDSITVSPQQVSLDWTPTQKPLNEFTSTTTNGQTTSSPATAALANFTSNNQYNKSDSKNESVDDDTRPLFGRQSTSSSIIDDQQDFNNVSSGNNNDNQLQVDDDYQKQKQKQLQQQNQLKFKPISPSSSEDDQYLPSQQPTEPPKTDTTTKHDKRDMTPKSMKTPITIKPPSPISPPSPPHHPTHKRSHAQITHESTSPKSTSSENMRNSSETQLTSPPQSPYINESSDEDYNDEKETTTTVSKPTRQRRRKGGGRKPKESNVEAPKITGKINPPNAHMPYSYETTSQGLTRCIYTSPIAPYKRCTTSFQRPYDLARHMETIHARDEAQLLKKGELTKDQLTIPGLASALEEAEKDPSKAKKLAAVQEWKCDGKGGCGSTFSRKDALIRHRRLRGHGVQKQH